MDQTEEALGWAAEGKKLAVDIPEVSVKDVGKFVAEMTPIVGDAMAAKEVYDELQKDEPNYYLAGALGGAALVGLFPGIGDVAAKAIRKGAREVFDVAKRVDVDMNAMGSGLGNVKLKPKVEKERFTKTQKAYKLVIRSEDEKNYPLFVNATDEIPEGVWLDAAMPPITFKSSNGNLYVPSKGAVRAKGEKSSGTGIYKAVPDQKTVDELKEAGFSVSAPTEKDPFGTTLVVAARPGFHTATVPQALHIGPEDIKISTAEKSKLLKAGIPDKAFKFKTQLSLDGKPTSKKKVKKLSEEDKKRVKSKKTYYVKRRAEDQRFAEVDLADDTSEDLKEYMKTRLDENGKPRKDINDKLPEGGSYAYTEGQADAETWLIGGNMRVNKVFTREEAKALQKKLGIVDLPHKDEIEAILGKKFNQGGLVNGEEDMYAGQMDFLETMQEPADQTVQAFALGGDVEEFDPVSGNEVPLGSLPEEVRDDIPAQLSEGEYIVPADVVRFHGVKKFEELRSEAKMGFNTMENTGRIGGEPIGVAVMGDELPFDVSELNMEDDGEPEAPMMNKGGYMTRGYAPGGMVNPVLQSSGGVEYKDYTNAEGKTLLIPFFNGVPMSVIPEGYFLVGTQATNAESEAAASAAAKAESDRKREGDRQDERRAPGGDLYDPTPVIKMEELTGKELEKMVADQGSMTADMINVGIGVINPIMGLFMKLGLTNSARQVKNELERRTMQSGNQQEQEYYANLLEIATQDEPGFVETVMGGIADTFSSVFQPQAKAEKIKSDYTPEEVAPESKYTGYTVAPPPEVITTELDDTPGARDDPYRNNPLVATSRFDGDEEQYRSYGAGSRTTDTTTPESTSTITDASNSGPTITKTSNKGDKADKNAAMRRAAKTAAANTKKVVTQAKKDLATPQEIEVIQKEGDRITKNLEDASRGMGLRLNKGGLMKKKKK